MSEINSISKPTIKNYGIYATHNMPCCVFHQTKPAVYNCNTSVFEPSWEARELGYFLVKADSKFKRWLLKTFFSIRG